MFWVDNSLVHTYVRTHAEQSFDKHRQLLHVVYGGRTKGSKDFISGKNQAVEKGGPWSLRCISIGEIRLHNVDVITGRRDPCVSVRPLGRLMPGNAAPRLPLWVHCRGRDPPSVAVFHDPVNQPPPPPIVKNDVCPKRRP